MTRTGSWSAQSVFKSNRPILPRRIWSEIKWTVEERSRATVEMEHALACHGSRCVPSPSRHRLVDERGDPTTHETLPVGLQAATARFGKRHRRVRVPGDVKRLDDVVAGDADVIEQAVILCQELPRDGPGPARCTNLLQSPHQACAAHAKIAKNPMKYGVLGLDRVHIDALSLEYWRTICVVRWLRQCAVPPDIWCQEPPHLLTRFVRRCARCE